MSIMVSFCAVFFLRGVLVEILHLIESVSEGFPSYTHHDPLVYKTFSETAVEI